MKRIIALVGLLLMLCCSSVFAQSVTAVGVGTTPSEAEQDAMRNAVEQVMGTLVDSSTLVRNAQLVEDSIYTTSRGFIEQYTVTDKRMEGGLWNVTIAANINTEPNGALMDKLTRMGIIQHSLRDAKIAVIIPEEHFSRRIPDPAGETAVIKEFLKAGFENVIDVSMTRFYHNTIAVNMSIEQLENIANSLQADILVVGEAFSEAGGPVPYMTRDIVSCKARLEAKMYIVRTGQILAADGTYGAAIDTMESIASKKALAQAGEEMGRYLTEQLLNHGSSARQQIEMVVLTTNINDVNALKNELAQIAGVKDVKFSRWDAGRATLTIRFSGAPQTLYDRLSESSAYAVDAVEITYNTLTVRI